LGVGACALASEGLSIEAGARAAAPRSRKAVARLRRASGRLGSVGVPTEPEPVGSRKTERVDGVTANGKARDCGSERCGLSNDAACVDACDRTAFQRLFGHRPHATTTLRLFTGKNTAESNSCIPARPSDRHALPPQGLVAFACTIARWSATSARHRPHASDRGRITRLATNSRTRFNGRDARAKSDDPCAGAPPHRAHPPSSSCHDARRLSVSVHRRAHASGARRQHVRS
jgi:hypothetical protein